MKEFVNHLREDPQLEGSAVHESQGDVEEAVGVLQVGEHAAPLPRAEHERDLETAGQLLRLQLHESG